MKKWTRRIRGALGLGLTWAVGWFAAGMALLLVLGPNAADVPFPLGFGLLGFLAGITFSGVLRVLGGRRSFDQMSLPRFALWGAVGGLMFSGAFVTVVALSGDAPLEMLVLGPVFALAGAGSAAGSLALARMGEDRDLLDGGAEVPDDLGLTEREREELLGDGG